MEGSAAVILKLTGCLSVMLCYDKHIPNLSHGVSTREPATPSPGVSFTEKEEAQSKSKSYLTGAVAAAFGHQMMPLATSQFNILNLETKEPDITSFD